MKLHFYFCFSTLNTLNEVLTRSLQIKKTKHNLYEIKSHITIFHINDDIVNTFKTIKKALTLHQQSLDHEQHRKEAARKMLHSHL